MTMVLNTVLEGKEYLVGDKCTYADLSFIPWAAIGSRLFAQEKIDPEKDYPNYHAWLKRLHARPAVVKILGAKGKA